MNRSGLLPGSFRRLPSQPDPRTDYLVRHNLNSEPVKKVKDTFDGLNVTASDGVLSKHEAEAESWLACLLMKTRKSTFM
jgi:hypothetical protein